MQNVNVLKIFSMLFSFCTQCIYLNGWTEIFFTDPQERMKYAALNWGNIQLHFLFFVHVKHKKFPLKTQISILNT